MQESRCSILKPENGLVPGHLQFQFKHIANSIVTVVFFLSLVQSLNLAAKCSRAQANMINREQWFAGLGVGLSAFYSLPLPYEK